MAARAGKGANKRIETGFIVSLKVKNQKAQQLKIKITNYFYEPGITTQN